MLLLAHLETGLKEAEESRSGLLGGGVGVNQWPPGVDTPSGEMAAGEDKLLTQDLRWDCFPTATCPGWWVGSGMWVLGGAGIHQAQRGSQEIKQLNQPSGARFSGVSSA